MAPGNKDDRDLQRYFDGELRPRRARQVREAIEGDPRLQGQLAALESMRGMVREASADAVDDADFRGLWARVHSGIEREPPLGLRERLGFWLRRWGVVLLGATAAAAVVLVVLVRPVHRPPPRNDAVIESLDVGPEAVGTIFTIAGPGESGQTTVIWVTETSAEGEE
jgi:anti-sigma factor RsiW